MNPYLLTGCGVLLLALALSGALLKHAWGENAALETRLAAAAAVIEQREKDAALNAKAVAQLADKLATTEARVITVTEKVYAAPITRECAQSPAMRAASDGVRSILSGGPTGDRAVASPAVR